MVNPFFGGVHMQIVKMSMSIKIDQGTKFMATMYDRCKGWYFVETI